MIKNRAILLFSLLFALLFVIILLRISGYGSITSSVAEQELSSDYDNSEGIHLLLLKFARFFPLVIYTLSFAFIFFVFMRFIRDYHLRNREVRPSSGRDFENKLIKLDIGDDRDKQV